MNSKTEFEESLKRLDDSIAELRRVADEMRENTWLLMLENVRNSSEFNDCLLRAKKHWGFPLPEKFITLAKKLNPQYSEQLEIFIIFG